MSFLKNQKIRMDGNKIIADQNYSTPGVYKIFDIASNQLYKININNFIKGIGEYKLWIADEKKNLLWMGDIINKTIRFNTSKILIGILFINTKYNNYFYLDDIKLKLMSKICINICTYDRYILLKKLLDNIQKEEIKESISLTVNIFDDGSPKNQIYKKTDYTYNINYFKAKFNHGKKKWYLLHNIILDKMKNTFFDFYYYISDDMIIVNNFFRRSIYLYNYIDDNRKIAINLNNDRGAVTQWTNFKPQVYDNSLYLTNWIDMCFICTKKLFKVLDYNLINFDPKKYSKLSSGVGNYISKTLFKKKYNMYLVKSSLVKHLGNDNSKMNPKIRQKQPLISR